MKYTITIKGEPVAKARPRMTRSGHVYTPAKTKHQEAEIGLAWVRKYHDLRIKKALSIEIIFNMKKAQKLKDKYVTKRPDIDNLIKTVLDGLNSVAYVDDKQVVKISATKQYSEEQSTIIEIREYED